MGTQINLEKSWILKFTWKRLRYYKYLHESSEEVNGAQIKHEYVNELATNFASVQCGI